MENSNGIPKPRDQVSYNISYSNYAKTSLLCSIIILFSAGLIMVCYYGYACGSRRGRHLLSLVNNSTNAAVSSQGLDHFIVKALPILVYSLKSHQQIFECAVCLSEFQEGEEGRVLPKCNHTFHIPCIDMWFHSHSNCPVCRAPVETVLQVIQPPDSGLRPSELGQKIKKEKGCFGGSSSSPSNVSLVSIVIHAPPPRDEKPTGLGPLDYSGSKWLADSVPSL